MISDEKYFTWLTAKARSFAAKYSVDAEDLLQDFFLSVAEGKTAKFEHVFFESIRNAYRRGITGKRDALEFVFDDQLLSRVRAKKKTTTDYEFVEYLCDLKSLLSDTEYKLVCMVLVGFDKGEVFEKTNELSRRELAAFWKRIGI